MKAYDDDDFFLNDRDEDDDTLDSLIDEEYNTFDPSEFDAEDDDAQWYDDDDDEDSAEDLESQGYSIEDEDDIKSFTAGYEALFYLLKDGEKIPDIEKTLRFLIRGLVLQMVE